MAILRGFGKKATLFVTMTANPKWGNIVAYLAPNSIAMNDPGLGATVFHLKQEAVIGGTQDSLREIFGSYWLNRVPKAKFTTSSYCGFSF
ncbi:hypothetical protein OnM2_082005 [Erysiphe neolycopersici]|uniref:Helitron helicase-like domain-containing protein n=1 Tax=Erysiphe neolycopersici TaxID=212602 RepID=A0A420HFW2_9PEZI|nr:hypothetical protein OnM2_082005 [Erysiphe neolycopersici]